MALRKIRKDQLQMKERTKSLDCLSILTSSSGEDSNGNTRKGEQISIPSFKHYNRSHFTHDFAAILSTELRECVCV